MQETDYDTRVENFLDRLLRSARGTFEVFTIYIGYRLGYYEALEQNGWSTAGELAKKTDTHPRYTREWLEQQTSIGICEVRDAQANEHDRRFRLPAAHAEVLTDRDSLNHLTPLSQIVVGAVLPIHRLLEAYRSGGGVPYGDYGKDLREGQAGMNRAMFLKQLGSEYLPIVADVHRRLRRDPPARVADIGCGFGWSSIGIAKTYPKVRVDGYDLDAPSVRTARHNADEARVADRVQFYVQDAGDPSLKEKYDLVTAFECVHDMPDPVKVLRTMLNLAGDSGAVIVMDERVAETFGPNGGEVEQMLYGFSVLHCLPAGMAEQPSAATGTVMRTETLRRYAADAGFCEVEVLPIDNFFFRFYRLKTACDAD
jgi:2-polyprenyl-3-methyl-5-hydroxy-6-metoxy-1,4-benzoquinol methylase